MAVPGPMTQDPALPGSSGASGDGYSKRLAQLKDEVARAARTGQTLLWSPPKEAAPLGAPHFPNPHQSPEVNECCPRRTGAESVPAAAGWAELDRQARHRHSVAHLPTRRVAATGLHLSATWR